MPDNEEKRISLLAKFITGIVIAWVATPLIIIFVFKLTGEDFELSPGTFGDMYGSLNALFAGLAFAGLLWTILLQQSEIKIQRTMLQAQLEEQKQARQSMDKQANAQTKMIAAINKLTTSTSIQSQMNKQIALFRVKSDRINAVYNTNDVLKPRKILPLTEEANQIEDSLNELSNMAALNDPNIDAD